MSTVKAEGRLLVLQGLLILCQTGALFCAGVALAVGVVAAAVGIGVGSGALALPGLFCLAAVAAVAVFSCRGGDCPASADSSAGRRRQSHARADAAGSYRT